MKSARSAVYELLMKAEKGAYSNLSLSGVLSKGNISDDDRRLISKLFYGVIERKLTLDHVISGYSRRPAAKLDIEVLTALRMGAYQLLFCGGIPESAAVNESVNIVKQAGKSSAAGFVNGVLRNMIRNGLKYELPKDKLQRLSVEYSCRPEIVSLLLDSCGEDKTLSLLRSSFEEDVTEIRVNTVKTDAEKLIEELEKDGIRAENTSVDVLKGLSLKITGGASLDHCRAFKDGLFHVQDISSQLCCTAAAPKKGDTVIDVCAAPGGKSFTMAEMMNGSGKIISCDIHEKRVELIKKSAERLGLSSVSAMCCDGKVFRDDLPSADIVLCDVPCSGLGVMKSKPEIKYKDPADFEGLPRIQYDILKNASRYVKSGSALIYSTCTVNSKENDGVTEKFLNESPGFEGAPVLPQLGKTERSVTFYPDDLGGSGFYICRMIRK